MSAKLLLVSLKTQEANLSLLIDSLDSQKDAIVKNNYVLLEEAIGKEQMILKNIEREESTRIKVVRELAKQLSVEIKENALDDLIENGSKHFKNEMKELTTVRKSLKNKIEKIRNTNKQLKDVIEFSRNLIKETMMIVAGPSKHALVNKRV